MVPFEALYGRRYRSPIRWFDAFEVRLWGTDLLRDSLEKVRFIQEKLIVAQSRQKEYTDHKVRDMHFIEGEQELLKVSPMKGVMHFRKRVLLDENLSYEEKPVAILDRAIRKLRTKEIASMKLISDFASIKVMRRKEVELSLKEINKEREVEKLENPEQKVVTVTAIAVRGLRS
ncbi:uncharacterized protein LOC124898552 [Capsicum annuum]|uniref:uncharacterized protein LOC124898552 n=1 Tax=Capsicum annuum TaxID=4072 RepID=UPI001FB149B8|nr:uncharacterized protein LOC124898552 [Capsicum annuum]